MRTGRPSLPTAVKQAKGTLRKHRQQKKEPKPQLGAPATPHGLDDDAKEEWSRLVAEALALKVLTAVDRAPLLIAAMAFSTWMRAERELAKEDSLTYENFSPKGGLRIKPRPECAIASDAQRRYFVAIVQLGLTPAARGKVSQANEPENEAPETRYFQ